MQGGDGDIFSAKRQKWHLFFVYFHDKKGKKMADSPIVTICRSSNFVFSYCKQDFVYVSKAC